MNVTFWLGVLAVWRATRLLTTDYLTERYRQWMESKHEMLGYLAACPWCTSIYLGAPAMTLAVLFPGNKALLIVFGALAASGITGMLTTLEDHWSDPE